MKYLHTPAVVVFFVIAIPVTANAYVGPGAGISAIAAILGVIGAILLALFAIVYYPIKRVIKRRKSEAKATARAKDNKS